MSMKVFVTGARGLLGSSLVPYLRKAGYEVVSHARQGGDVAADLTIMDQVDDALNKVRPSVIVNLAALTNVDECERQPQAAYLANVKIVENLVSWIQRNGTTCYLVQISTDQVYDGAGMHAEADLQLRNYYAFSKYAGELVAQLVPSTTLRTNFFGPSESLGRTSLSDWVVKSTIQGEHITVFEDVQFSPLSMQSLIKYLEIVIALQHPGVFNLGSKTGMSKAEFAFSLAETLALPIEKMRSGSIEALKLTAYRPKNMVMDSSYFENTFKLVLPSLVEEIHSMKACYAD